MILDGNAGVAHPQLLELRSVSRYPRANLFDHVNRRICQEDVTYCAESRSPTETGSGVVMFWLILGILNDS